MNNEEKILEMLEKMDQRMDRMEAAQAEMQAAQAEMQADISGIKVRLDTEVTTNFNLLAEGHRGIVQKLKTLDEVKELAEDTKDKVDVIYSVVKQHSGEIAELKKAQ